MIFKKFTQVALMLTTLAGTLLFVQAFAKEQQAKELSWEDLVPNDYVFVNPLDELTDEEYYALTDDSEKAQELFAKIQYLMDTAPVVEELNGVNVRLSGYALPLDYDEKNVREFLLVPYFGACIHVPPPPGNQTVYVKSDKGFDLQGLWEPVSVVGQMETIRVSSELAAAGYSLSATKIEAYKE